MGSKKLLVTGAVITAVAAAAILVPSVATGVPLALPFAPAAVVAPHDGPGENGRGNAFGHDKHSDRFPGDGDKKDKADKHDDGPGRNGRGNAFGHDKDSPAFPGNRSGNGNR